MPDAPTLTLTSSVYERLRRDVLKAHLAPGEPLRIEALCARYDVGASPLREALNRLSAEGIVLREEKRGFRVPPVSLKDLRELTETRCWINELGLRPRVGGVRSPRPPSPVADTAVSAGHARRVSRMGASTQGISRQPNRVLRIALDL